MTAMSCAEAEDLLGAYALDALPDEDARRVEEHLRHCEEHRVAAAALRQTSGLLPLTAEERAPSPGLRQRILEAVKTSPAGSVAEQREAPPTPVIARPKVRRVPAWLPRPTRLAVAATVAIGLGISALIGYQLGEISGRPVAYTFQGDASAAPGAEARLVYFKDRREAVLAANGLPTLGPGQVYEMWLIKNGVPVDKGVSVSSTGSVGAQLQGDLSQFQQFAITIEPGEQQLPTTKPIMLGSLQGGSS
jgi:anti-sigma-K factor RskA